MRSFIQAIACVAMFSSVATAWNPLEHQTYANAVLNSVAGIDTMQTTAWAYWAQSADHALIPLFKQIQKAGDNYTIALPNIAGFRKFTKSKGVNTTDLHTLNSKGWKPTWAEVYPYHFLKTTVKTTVVRPNQTVILDSYKTSPAGNWPLQMVYYMDGAIKAKDVVPKTNTTTLATKVNKSGIFNGTFGDSFYGQYNVTIPDTKVGSFGIAQTVGGWVNEPKWLKDTLDDLSINYSSLVALSPSFAGYSYLRHTLFLPPASSIPTGSRSEFEAFVGKHLVKSLVYSPTYGSGGKNLTALDGSTIAWTDGGVNGAKVLHKDVLTNAMVLQLIDKPFAN